MSVINREPIFTLCMRTCSSTDTNSASARICFPVGAPSGSGTAVHPDLLPVVMFFTMFLCFHCNVPYAPLCCPLRLAILVGLLLIT
jgi:hypothetical protein